MNIFSQAVICNFTYSAEFSLFSGLPFIAKREIIKLGFAEVYHLSPVRDGCVCMRCTYFCARILDGKNVCFVSPEALNVVIPLENAFSWNFEKRKFISLGSHFFSCVILFRAKLNSTLIFVSQQ